VSPALKYVGPIAEDRRQCLLDAYEVTTCPNCRKDISQTSSEGRTEVLCDLENEGGLQSNLDILPILSEELYLKAYPEERKPRAFLEFCREGDIEAIVDLVKANDDDGDSEDEDDMADSAPLDTAALLRYQDSVTGMRSALHFAVEHSKLEVVWLLLLLASTLAPEHFPAQVQQAAQDLGISRPEQTGKTDIRSLKDTDGKIAAELADEDFRSRFDVALLLSS
jgi:hypothetical protein